MWTYLLLSCRSILTTHIDHRGRGRTGRCAMACGRARAGASVRHAIVGERDAIASATHRGHRRQGGLHYGRAGPQGDALRGQLA